jgi:hypothetical protein
LGKPEDDALRKGVKHRDLWEQIWRQRHRIVEVMWVKAHLTKVEAESDGWDLRHWAGNQEADRLATSGVGMHSEDWEEVYKFREKKRRMEEIQAYLLNRFKTLACRRDTRWGADVRRDNRMKGPWFVASFREKRHLTRGEKFEGYLRQHSLAIRGRWEQCVWCQKRTRYPGTRANRAAAWRSDCVRKDGFNGHSVMRVDGGSVCKTCGRKGRLLKKVSCGRKLRGRKEEVRTGKGLPGFWGQVVV